MNGVLFEKFFTILSEIDVYCLYSNFNIPNFYTSTILITHITNLLTKTTAAQNEVALSYYKVRGLYFLADL